MYLYFKYIHCSLRDKKCNYIWCESKLELYLIKKHKYLSYCLLLKVEIIIFEMVLKLSTLTNKKQKWTETFQNCPECTVPKIFNIMLSRLILAYKEKYHNFDSFFHP